MEQQLSAYSTATNQYLEKFDLIWNETLLSLDLDYPQLRLGHRLRPQICLWGYYATLPYDMLLNQNYEKIARIAVCIEMVHKASLIIDDWIDDDNERHGVSALHIDYGAHQAILVALNMIGNAMEGLKNAFPDTIVLPQNYVLCLDTIIQTICSMAKGALEEICLNNSTWVDIDSTHEIVRLETSSIIGNSLLLGYYAGLGDEEENRVIVDLFTEIGNKCGYLFQVLNDMEPFVNPTSLIKHKGKLNFDFQTHRKNYVVSTLYEIACHSDRERMATNDIELLLELVKKYKIVQTLHSEVDAVFAELVRLCASKRVISVSDTWSQGFQGFLYDVRRFAEFRLRK